MEVIISIIVLYFIIKLILRIIIIKRKKVYCIFCKYYMPFIYSICQEDCYHPKNIIIDEITSIKKKYRVKYIDEDGLNNKEHNCKYFKLGLFYKIYLVFKLNLFF